MSIRAGNGGTRATSKQPRAERLGVDGQGRASAPGRTCERFSCDNPAAEKPYPWRVGDRVIQLRTCDQCRREFKREEAA